MIPPLAALAVLAAVFVGLCVLERVAPLRIRKRPTLRRILVNAGVAVPAGVVSAGLIVPTATAMLAWTGSSGFGLLEWLALPAAIELVLGFVLLDLAFYWWHRANHDLPILWRFHAAHHVDPDLDVTTAARFHFGEMLFSVGFQAVQIAILGVPIAAYIAYQVVFEAGTLFHHSNWRLPRRLERLLSLLVVTPRTHGIHHSQIRAEVSSNFSVVFNLWDRLHRTLRLDVPQERIVVGIPAYDAPQDNHLGHVLGQPFRAQPPYWPEEPERDVPP